MKFYAFYQNNSGGITTVDDDNGIGDVVIIEANSPGEANDIAENIGIYFDGVENQKDCECCGDRWMRAETSDEYDGYVGVIPKDKGIGSTFFKLNNKEKDVSYEHVYVHRYNNKN